MIQHFRFFYQTLPTTLVLCLLFCLEVASLERCHADSLVTKEIANKEIANISQDNDEIVLSLVYHPHGRLILRPPQLSPEPILVVWKDGRVLYGQSVQLNGVNEDSLSSLSRILNLQYFLGKISTQDAEELLKKTLESFRLDENGGRVFYVALGSSYTRLYGNIDGKIFTVSTGGIYIRDAAVVSALVDGTRVNLQEKDGALFTLTQFFDTWQKTMIGLREFGKFAVKENSAPVRVNVESNVEGSQMTVLDEHGNTLIRMPWLPVF